MYVDPCNSAEKLTDLSISLLVSFFVALATQRTPERSIRTIHMLLNSAGPYSQDRRILMRCQLVVRQMGIQPIELIDQSIFLGQQDLVSAGICLTNAEASQYSSWLQCEKEVSQLLL